MNCPCPLIRIDKKLHRALKIAAAEDRVSMKEFVGRILEAELEKRRQLKAFETLLFHQKNINLEY